MAQIAAQRTESAAAAVANPAPLGLSAFALTTFVLSSYNAGLFKVPFIVIGLALFYGGLVQLVAGIQEFRTGNTFGATAFCSYAGFWLAVGVILMPATGVILGYGGLTPAFHIAFGYFLLGWTIFTAGMFVGTLRSTIALIVVFGLLLVTFILLTLGQLTLGSGFETAGGWLGIVTAIAAWYTAMAGISMSTKSIYQLPVGPMR